MQIVNCANQKPACLTIEMNIRNKEIMSYSRFTVRCSNVSRIFNKKDILYIAADSNYSTIIFTDGQKIFTSKTLKYWEFKLHDVDLLRTHKSFSINQNFAIRINNSKSEIELTGGIKIPVSRSLKKDLLLKLLK
ncbi:MAG: LytTR family transcriptional regulator [Saprospiraceae bacterium]|nr:LytTR family transcriptional regulator [Saprospiraceae bacterium]